MTDDSSHQVQFLIIWWKQLAHGLSLFCIYTSMSEELDLKLNNINLYQLFLLILLITYYHYFIILNLWNTIKFKYHNQWVAYL